MRNVWSVIALLVLSVLSVSAFTPGADLDIESVEVNNVDVEALTRAQFEASTVDQNSGLVVEEGETLEIDVVVWSQTDAQNIQVEADLRGYEYNDYEDLTDRTHVRNLVGTPDAPSRRSVRLTIDLPAQLEDDRYILRVSVEDKDSPSVERFVVLQIEPPRHGVNIASVVFSPYGNSVEAGRSLLANVLLRNYGDRNEKDVEVTATIAALGVQAYESVDLVRVDEQNSGSNVDYEDVSELWLPIPANAAAGQYQVVVKVRYDDLRETVAETFTINVVESTRFRQAAGPETLVLAVGPETQNVAAGGKATYVVALTNAGTSSKAYTIEAVSGDWASVAVSEPLVVVEAGKNKVVYVDVTAKENAVAGPQMVSVTVKADGETLKTVTLQSTVVAGAQGSSLRNGLEVALIVLVVLLVIVGLIIGFSRLRKDDEDEEKTYY